MSAAERIEAGQFFVDPCADRFRSEPEPRDVWDLSLPLPLPEPQVAALRRIARRVNDTRPGMTPGMIAVFTGRDAVGKLMAAEALAYEIQRTLYRVDAREMSLAGKSHFAQTLQAARGENAVLMLDNADGLPVSLIRCLRCYPGLSILAMDSSRISKQLCRSAHFVVDFAFSADSEQTLNF